MTFTPDSFHRYGVSSLGTEPLRLVVKIVRSGTDTPNDPEGGVSLLSDDSIRATVNKTALTAAKSSLEQDLAQEANTSGKTEASKQAYEAAKTKAREAINKAKEIEAKQDATEAEVQEALEKLTEAKQGLSTAKNNLVDVNKGDQGNGQSGDQGGSASGGQTAPNTQAKSTTKARTKDTANKKTLPNTGATDSTALLAAAASSVILGLGLARHRRKKD